MEKSFDEILQSFPAASDYLSTMYLIQRDYGSVANSRLASFLGVSRPAVSQAVSRLKKLGLISQERYGDILLTDFGSQFARKMLRRHYLLEHFLMNNLEMTWDEIDEEAKRLQNSISDNFEEKMFNRLGKPETCPHGNPIPGSSREQEILAYPKLEEAPMGREVLFIRITEVGEEIEGLLSFFYQSGVRLGDRVVLLSRDQDHLHVQVTSPEGQLRHQDLAIPLRFLPYLCYQEG